MPRIGLALGGGGARGWAHIGVIRALQESGAQIACVAGTSMGALVGAAFAAGQLDALEASARQVNWKEVLYHFFEVTLPRSGLIDGRKVVSFVRRHVPTSRIEELRLPFAAVATDLETGEEVILWRGDVLEAVRSSLSIPGIFTPARWDGRTLVDGGLVNPVPVSAARALGAEFIVAVDVRPARLVAARRRRAGRSVSLSESWKHIPMPHLVKPFIKRVAQLDAKVLKHIRRWQDQRGDLTIFDVLGNAIAVMQAQITDMRLRIDRPDLVVHPEMDFGLMEFHRAAEAIEIGYRAAMRALKESGWRSEK
jgi:NTE family protein